MVEALRLEIGQLRPHGRWAPADLVAARDRLRPDRPAIAHVGVDDSAQDCLLSLRKHDVDCRFTGR